MRLPGDDPLSSVNGGLSWISGEGPHADIILSTRVRLARNLEHFPFRETIAAPQQEQVTTEIIDGYGEAKGSTGAARKRQVPALGELQETAEPAPGAAPVSPAR